MTIYHSSTWNFDADTAVLQHAGEVGQPILEPYIQAGFCTGEHYWSPPNPVAGGGLYTMRRVWTDADQMAKWAAETNQMRANDTQLHDVVSEVTCHNDNDYNPATA